MHQIGKILTKTSHSEDLYFVVNVKIPTPPVGVRGAINNIPTIDALQKDVATKRKEYGLTRCTRNLRICSGSSNHAPVS
jgi:hypothetical protein